MRRFVVTLCLALCVAGGFTGAASATTFDVSIQNFSYSPAMVTIQQGDSVRWTNNEGTHTTTSDVGAWNSGILSVGQTFSHRFNDVGTFTYHCDVHGPSMNGQVTVQAPTAVQFLSFGVVRTRAGVLVRWRTASETATLGFDVFRQGRGERVRVNRTLLPARGGLGGHAYSFVDARAPRIAAPLRYWLRVRSEAGNPTWYGPRRLLRQRSSVRAAPSLLEIIHGSNWASILPTI
jgi:plastocyanin